MYNDLAEEYHLLYKDWNAAITYQASTIDRIVKRYFETPSPRIHDISCGIGTQLIGLLELGYCCSGSDLSAKAIERARRELDNRSLIAKLAVADMTKPMTSFANPDIVLSWDNSICHLRDESAVTRAVALWFSWAKYGVIINIRDYGDPSEQDTFYPYGQREENGINYFVFQSREYAANHYQVHFYLVADDEKNVSVRKFTDRFFMLSVDRLCEICRSVGFSDVVVPDVGYHKPVIVAYKR